MKLKLLALALLLVPGLLLAWPQPGTPAPNASVADTAYVSHTIPSEYAGRAIFMLCWQST
jgi:hypothetical protein